MSKIKEIHAMEKHLISRSIKILEKDATTSTDEIILANTVRIITLGHNTWLRSMERDENEGHKMSEEEAEEFILQELDLEKPEGIDFDVFLSRVLGGE